MFNTYTKISTNNTTNNTTKFNINACSGGIYKTYLESWFERFHLQSEKSQRLLCKETFGSQKDKVVLQMVICGDMEVIAEIIDKKDLEKYFSNPIDNKE